MSHYVQSKVITLDSTRPHVVHDGKVCELCCTNSDGDIFLLYRIRGVGSGVRKTPRTILSERSDLTLADVSVENEFGERYVNVPDDFPNTLPEG